MLEVKTKNPLFTINEDYKNDSKYGVIVHWMESGRVKGVMREFESIPVFGYFITSSGDIWQRIPPEELSKKNVENYLEGVKTTKYFYKDKIVKEILVCDSSESLDEKLHNLSVALKNSEIPRKFNSIPVNTRFKAKGLIWQKINEDRTQPIDNAMTTEFGASYFDPDEIVFVSKEILDISTSKSIFVGTLSIECTRFSVNFILNTEKDCIQKTVSLGFKINDTIVKNFYDKDVLDIDYNGVKVIITSIEVMRQGLLLNIKTIDGSCNRIFPMALGDKICVDISKIVKVTECN